MAPDHEDATVHAFLRGDPAAQLAWLRARGLPDATLLALHNACAQRCFFCAGPGTVEVPAAEVTRPDAALATLRARPEGVTRLLIGGNEPTLHPAFEALIAAARPAGFTRVDLMTNGVALAERASAWAAAGLVEVVVPLYAVEPAVHDAVCGVPCHAAVVRGLDAAARAGIRVSVHTLLLRRTLSGLGALAGWAAERWGGRIGVGLLRDKGRFDYGEEAPRLSEVARALEAIPEALRPVGLVTPACLPTGDGAAPLLAELYFRTQRRIYAEVCEGCRARAGCPGVVPGYAGEVRAR